MLRMHVAQQCFGLSDEGIEDALYDSRFRLTEDTFSAHHRASWVSPLMDGQLIRGSIADRSPDQEWREILESHRVTFFHRWQPNKHQNTLSRHNSHQTCQCDIFIVKHRRPVPVRQRPYEGSYYPLTLRNRKWNFESPRSLDRTTNVGGQHISPRQEIFFNPPPNALGDFDISCNAGFEE